MTRKELIDYQKEVCRKALNQKEDEFRLLSECQYFNESKGNFRLFRGDGKSYFGLSVTNHTEKNLSASEYFIKSLMHLTEEDAIERLEGLIEQLTEIKNSLDKYLNGEVDYDEFRKSYLNSQEE